MSKNQEYKESGSTLPFKEWLRQSLDKDVQQTVQAVGYKSADGQCTAACNYKPYVSGNTVFGVNKWLIFGAIALAAGAIAYGVYGKRTNNV